MNPAEARERFRSAAGKEDGLSADITLDEAKQKFRNAATELDHTLGLHEQEYGAWSAALIGIAMLLGAARSRSWLVPLFSGLASFGGKALDTVLALFVKKSEEKKPRRTKKKLDTKG
jgi:hypothetical protein